MNNVPVLQQLAEKEPWRQGAGLPVNALDPTWEPGAGDRLCGGDVEWEPGTRWWVCQRCGRIGSMYRLEHKPIQNPIHFLLGAIQFFLGRHAKLTQAAALERMAVVAGTALRYAAVQQSLGKYIDGLVTK